MPLKCMLLAAGHGNRLRPLTVSCAKPALPLAGRPLLCYTLAQLRAAGVEEVLINLHHEPDSVRAAVESDLPSGLSITYAEEAEILGTAGALKAVEGLLGDEECFLLVNGDCYYGFPFGPLVAAHRRRRAFATMALQPYPYGGSYGRVEVGAGGLVSRIAGRPRVAPIPPAGDRMFVGAHVLSRDVWRYMGRTGNYDINGDVYPAALQAGETVYGEDMVGAWHDIGTPRRYLAANLDLCFSAPGQARSSTWPGVIVEPPVVAAADVEVGAGTILQGSAVLEAGVRLGNSCIVARSVVGRGARIGNRCTIQDAVVGRDAVVADNTDLVECAVVPFAGNEARLRRRELVGDNVIARFETYERR